MKKIIGLVFAIVCMFSVSMTAFAASNMNSDGLNPEDVSTNVHHVEIHAYGGTFSHKVIFENSSPEVVTTEVWGDDLPAGTFLNTNKFSSLYLKALCVQFAEPEIIVVSSIKTVFACILPAQFSTLTFIPAFLNCSCLEYGCSA